MVPSIEGQIAAIRALTPPAGDEATVTKLTDDAQAAIDKVKQDPSLLGQKSNNVFAASNKETLAYGLKVCGAGG